MSCYKMKKTKMLPPFVFIDLATYEEYYSCLAIFMSNGTIFKSIYKKLFQSAFYSKSFLTYVQ